MGSVADRAQPVGTRLVHRISTVYRLAKPRNRLHHDAASGATRTLTQSLVVPFSIKYSPDRPDR